MIKKMYLLLATFQQTNQHLPNLLLLLLLLNNLQLKLLTHNKAPLNKLNNNLLPNKEIEFLLLL
jgi:hypothetical protein